MHETSKGQYCDQEFFQIPNKEMQVRLDYAMRLWATGLDELLLNDPNYSHNIDHYNQIVQKSPATWYLYRNRLSA